MKLVTLERESHEEAMRLADERHDATIEALRESDYRRANPGDYECPDCKPTTLKKNATRCPMCHGTPSQSYCRPCQARNGVCALA